MFPSWQSYSNFAHAVVRQERYVRSVETSAFIEAVLSTSITRERLIREGTILWRAQLGFDMDEVESDGRTVEAPAPYSPARMKPLPFARVDGRVNPVGISALYLATDERTAISEVRPWIGKHVSVAQLKIMREVKVIDCSLGYSEGFLFYEQEPSPEDRENAVWHCINRAFAEPVSDDRRTTEYIPTQVLAEYFRAHGVDGVVYQSLLGGGKTVALFDVRAADVINCALHYVRGVNFSYDQVANPYFVGKHYPDTKSNV